MIDVIGLGTHGRDSSVAPQSGFSSSFGGIHLLTVTKEDLDQYWRCCFSGFESLEFEIADAEGRRLQILKNGGVD